MTQPRLFIVIPCYNEEAVLPLTAPLFLQKLRDLSAAGKIAEDSRVLFVNDGSKDKTWQIIRELAAQDEHYIGISQSRNRGHQNAVLAGLMEARDKCDITISIDCDGQDDINAMDEMVDAYLDGCEVVYGVRSSRETDTFFKRFTAESFYKFLAAMGAEVVFNHADYRLISARVLDGVTSLSVKPLRLIFGLGLFIAFVSFIFCIWALITALCGRAVAGWASMTCIICFVSGVQLICLGIIAEYIGKIYMETKQRPRYIISERTWDDKA